LVSIQLAQQSDRVRRIATIIGADVNSKAMHEAFRQELIGLGRRAVTFVLTHVLARETPISLATLATRLCPSRARSRKPRNPRSADCWGDAMRPRSRFGGRVFLNTKGRQLPRIFLPCVYRKPYPYWLA